MNSENTIGRVRKVRQEISQSFDNDPEKLIHYYQQKQKKYNKRLISQEEYTVKEKPAEYDE